uniref:Uncharacterized protein n=1 Tax=Xenopus tropicalis TaxID=8364 RepID=A0A803K4F4_XENTR
LDDAGRHVIAPDKLSCPLCREIYTDPVTLPCGHNYCLRCIGGTWGEQGERRKSRSCPECGETYRKNQKLETNVRLCDNVKQFHLQKRTCSEHKKMLEYYCPKDGACICVSCWLVGEHRGHRVELLTAGETKGVTALFRGIRERLEALEMQLLWDIPREQEKASLQLHDLIHQLEIKKDELPRKIHHIEELCNMADPLTVLQAPEPDGAGFHGAEGADNKGRERYNINAPAVEDLDVGWISETLLTGLAGIVAGVKRRIFGQEATDLVLDIETAGSHVVVSGDGKSASYSPTAQHYPQSPERFQEPQALSTSSFPSGRHYWDVEGSESGEWRVGVAYPSIERRGYQSWIGDNNKSWCLYRWQDNSYSVMHDRKWNDLPHTPSCSRIRISLDYKAGFVSFYELSEPIRHLHTFTASFTEGYFILYIIYKSHKYPLYGHGTPLRLIISLYVTIGGTLFTIYYKEPLGGL